MTRQRDLKRDIRERMRKTGERYMAARAQVLTQRVGPPPAKAYPGVLPEYTSFGGIQGDTGALRNLLAHAGARDADGSEWNEELVAGLCGGVGFMYFVFEYQGLPPMLTMTLRANSMPNAFLAEGLWRCGVETQVSETGSARVAAKALDDALAAGRPALCTVDVALMPHHGMPAEWAGMGPHEVVVVGHDGDHLWIDDRRAFPLRIAREVFDRARAGYRKGKQRLVTLGEPVPGHNLSDAVLSAMRHTVRAFHEAPYKGYAANFGLAGLEKWQRLLTDGRDKKGWPRLFAAGPQAFAGLRRVHECLQVEGTAPDGSRPAYASFLDQAARLTARDGLTQVAGSFRASSELWGELSALASQCDDEAVRAGCALSEELNELVDAKGVEAAPEVEQLVQRRMSLGKECRLDTDQTLPLYAAMAERVGRILEVERAAVAELERILA